MPVALFAAAAAPASSAGFCFCSFATALAFPYLLAWTGSPSVFFITGAVLNLLAVAAWLFVEPQRPLNIER